MTTRCGGGVGSNFSNQCSLQGMCNATAGAGDAGTRLPVRYHMLKL
uniref:Uncharacterized protein n=1 Tax=Anguilla anguilla TaxID=7936 RepID=A0A0E9R9Q4_ANGAN